jgi:uncharacterized protein (DUF924 family)
MVLSGVVLSSPTRRPDQDVQIARSFTATSAKVVSAARSEEKLAAFTEGRYAPRVMRHWPDRPTPERSQVDHLIGIAFGRFERLGLKSVVGNRKHLPAARAHLHGANHMEIASSQDVVAFWFSSAQTSRWYAKDVKFDEEIRRRFLTTYEAACSGTLDEWRRTPESLLSLIILLDQFPRNMFRDSARAFASDGQAVRLTKEGIVGGLDRSLSGAQLNFFYMPLMHSESLSDQDLLIERGHGDNRYAREHHEIIARFGRFPHRNQTLGRENTTEEVAYLARPRSSL